MKWTIKFLASMVLVAVLGLLVFYFEILFCMAIFLRMTNFRFCIIPIVLISYILWKLPGWMKL